jgi:hypothetical protein
MKGAQLFKTKWLFVFFVFDFIPLAPSPLGEGEKMKFSYPPLSWRRGETEG